jgi:phage tail-like protein
VSVDFAELLYRSLPGLYRDKDVDGELHRFLEIMALPLGELESSVEQLYQDFYIERCREPFVALLGDLVGVTVDPTLPTRAQRGEVREALHFYRSKGLQIPLERFAESVSGFRVTLVDFSGTVALVPFLEASNPVELRRDRSVGEDPPGSGHYFFREDRALQPLFDGIRGRPITRVELSGNEALYAGVEGRFSIEHRGVSLFGAEPGSYTAVAADLTDFTQPKTPGGAPLSIGTHEIALDPLLGRFLSIDPTLLAGNLRGTYSALSPASIRAQAFDIRRPGPIGRLGRVDDPAPYTLDLRAPRRATDAVGRQHFDNHGFFVTPGREFANQRANVLPPQTESGNFSFDNRPLPLADANGVRLQLLDAWDGAPLTRRALMGRELEFAGTRRGFTIRIGAVAVTDPEFAAPVRVVAADLGDFSNPRSPTGAPLLLAATDVAVDPELGRFRLDLAALGARAEQVRVDFLLAAAALVEDGEPLALSASVPEFFAFLADGATLPLRDRLDGTPIAVALRLGRSVSDYEGGGRGFSIRKNGVDVAASLSLELIELDAETTPVTPGRVAVDVGRARFKFPTGFLAPGDQIRVDYAFEDPLERNRVFENVAQRLPRALPAGTVPVLIDTRRVPANPAKVD